VQRRLYLRRRVEHLTDPMRKAAGLPMGQSLRGTSAIDARELQKLLESDRAAE
jgi:hypothetical protein